ncbi:MAG: DUF6157 family protein [Stackebrandtia sp.]
MNDMNYYDTLITAAEDCPVDHGVVPAPRGGKKTVAVMQYEMLAESPHVYTQEDVLFDVWLARQDLAEVSNDERRRLRAEFFAKPQACLRASPLPKKHGWGLLFDPEGRVALCAADSPRYRDLVGGAEPDVKLLPAMRSKRA